MKTFRSVLTAGALAVVSVSALAQMTAPGPRDPYTQGGATAAPVDPATGGARTGDKFDPYSQGAVQPTTRQDLAPQQQMQMQQQMQIPSQQFDLVPGYSTAGGAYGSSAYRGDMRLSTPNLGRPLGDRNRFLDGA